MKNTDISSDITEALVTCTFLEDSPEQEKEFKKLALVGLLKLFQGGLLR